MSALAECITRGEFCQLLRISTKTARRMARDGVGPRPVALSPRLARYPVDEVRAFMASNGLSVPAEIVAEICL